MQIEMTREQVSQLIDVLYASHRLNTEATVDLILHLNNALNADVAASFGLQAEASPDDQGRVRAGILHTYCRHRQGIHPQASGLF